MPLYEYECDGGHKFEEIRSIEDRYNAVCPECKKLAHLKMSPWGRVIFTAWNVVKNHDGTVLSRTQSAEEIPMLPEKVHGGRF